MELSFQVQLKIMRPPGEVFDAVADPQKLAGYFVAEASAPLVPGTTVLWKFPEFPDRYPVVVREVVRPERIVLEWESDEPGRNTRIEMTFSALDGGATMVQVTEAGWRDTPEGRKASYGNAGGWMHMMMCLKAYLEYGINLRKDGAM